MIRELTNGRIYTIPDKVVSNCKYIQIRYNKLDQKSRTQRRDWTFQYNEKSLEDYTYIGYEYSKHHDGFDTNVEIHWFIRTVELHECQCYY